MTAEIEPIDYAMLYRRKRAVFNPKKLNLKPGLEAFIGQTFVFQCEDYGHEDDPYPGQYRWYALVEGSPVTRAKDDSGQIHPVLHYWIPDEDLCDVT